MILIWYYKYIIKKGAAEQPASIHDDAAVRRYVSLLLKSAAQQTAYM